MDVLEKLRTMEALLRELVRQQGQTTCLTLEAAILVSVSTLGVYWACGRLGVALRGRLPPVEEEGNKYIHV